MKPNLTKKPAPWYIWLSLFGLIWMDRRLYHRLTRWNPQREINRQWRVHTNELTRYNHDNEYFNVTYAHGFRAMLSYCLIFFSAVISYIVFDRLGNWLSLPDIVQFLLGLVPIYFTGVLSALLFYRWQEKRLKNFNYSFDLAAHIKKRKY